MIRSRISCDDVYKFKKYKTDPITNEIIGICMVSEKTGKEVCFSNNYAPSEEDIETFFVVPSEDHTFISSRLVKEVARLGGEVGAFVPEHVKKALISKLQ